MTLARDLGSAMHATIHTDAQAMLGMVNRQGLGKLRHINVQYLWIQEKVRDKSLNVKKVPGADNPADLMTKYRGAADIERHLDNLYIERRDNRAGLAPKLQRLQWRQHDEWSGNKGDTFVREHTRPRRDLFTPMRVECAKPATQ